MVNPAGLTGTQKFIHTVVHTHINTKVHSDTNTRCPQKHSGTRVTTHLSASGSFLCQVSEYCERLGYRWAKRVIYHKTGPGLMLLSNWEETTRELGLCGGVGQASLEGRWW